MKQAMRAVWKALFRGLLVVVPVYLAILLLLKGMKSVAKLVRPFTALLPDWVPPKISCRCSSFLRSAPSSAPPWVLASDGGLGTGSKGPSRANPRLWGHPQPHAPDVGKKPREHLEARAGRDRRCPCSGVHHRGIRGRALHRLRPVDPDTVRGCGLRARSSARASVDVPFTDAVRVISRWGSGAKNLVAAMERHESVVPR